jgi:hypothetical protein
MTTIISDKIRSRLERLDASVQAPRETIRQPLLEYFASIHEALKATEQVLREALREGLEREALLSTLAKARSPAENGAKFLEHALAIFEGDAAAEPMIQLQLREATAFLAWVRGLEARFAAPVPPFDESRLTPAPNGPSAEGYLSVSAARARLRAAQKP